MFSSISKIIVLSQISSCLWNSQCLRDGLFLKIQPYKMTRVTIANKALDFVPKIVEGYNRIYVGNLSWDITEDDLRKFLSDCKISSIRFGMDKETGEFRGYAHVDFADSMSLSMALKLDQQIVCGRPAKISYAVPPKKGVNTQSRTAPASNVATTNITDNTASNVVTSNITDNNTASNVATSNGTDNSGVVTVSGKIRRRTCYECGEKGHLSSACPKKTADTTNSSTSWTFSRYHKCHSFKFRQTEVLYLSWLLYELQFYSLKASSFILFLLKFKVNSWSWPGKTYSQVTFDCVMSSISITGRGILVLKKLQYTRMIFDALCTWWNSSVLAS